MPSEAPEDSVAPEAEPGAVAALAEVREAHATMRRFVRTVEADGRYPMEAYRFLQEGLEHTVRRVHGDDVRVRQARTAAETGTSMDEHPNHVTGRDLCEGLADLALTRYGVLADAVLHAWNVHSTDDFGEMVFLMVEHDFLQKTSRDNREDFHQVLPLGGLGTRYAIDAPPQLDADGIYPSPHDADAQPVTTDV